MGFLEGVGVELMRGGFLLLRGFLDFNLMGFLLSQE
jgi:hypothetical protein